MWNLKYGKNNPIYKTEIDHDHGEQTCICQGGGGREWALWKGADIGAKESGE